MGGGTPGASKIAIRQAHARVRREGAMQERGSKVQAVWFQSSPFRSALRETDDPARMAGWVRACEGIFCLIKSTRT